MINGLLSTCFVILNILWVNIQGVHMHNGCETCSCRPCCPNLLSVDPSTIPQVFSFGPLFVVFVPVSPLNLALDNVCYTNSSLPDGASTSLVYISRVYSTGENQVQSYIVTQPQTGVARFGSSECSFMDIPFANVTLQGCGQCNMTLIYRCVLNDGCGSDFDVNPPIFGLSSIAKPISSACIQEAKLVIKSFNFPDQNYITYPMKLPTECVYRQ